MKNLFPISLITLIMTSCVSAQSTILRELESSLSSRKSTTTDVLTNPALMSLHPASSFRELIKRFAKQEKIVLVTAAEPGARITIKGKLSDKNHKPLPNTLVYVYHTDNKGWYSDTAGHVTSMGGDRNHARLFGYFRTMNDGSFQLKTIHPQGYPNSDLPQHIHFEVFANNGKTLLVTELLFNDDERLNASVREHMTREGAFIASGTNAGGEQVYNYEIITRD